MEPGYRPIPVDKLHFDPNNPRLPVGVDANDDQAVLDWMLEDAGLVELMGSIAVNGYFPAEPLLVTPRAEPQDGYWVLEGNRRLAAVLLLLDPSRAPRRRKAVQSVAAEAASLDTLNELPCAVFDDRSAVLDYLGFRHVTGIKEWEPVAKARYVDALYNKHFASTGEQVYKHIARIIGSRSDYVARLLVSLRLYEKISLDTALADAGLDLEEISFSLLTLALNYASIVEYLGLDSVAQESVSQSDSEALRHLATWLFVTRTDLNRTQLGESRNMKLLAAAVASPNGLEALGRGETVEEAATATLDVNDLFRRSIRQSRTNLISAQRLIHRVDVARPDVALLEESLDLLEQLLLLSRRRMRGNGV